MKYQQNSCRSIKGAKRRTLAESCEYLTRDWDLEKNKGLTPFDILRSDTRLVHWKCQHCGYEFQNSVKNRYYRKTKCPSCLGQESSPSGSGFEKFEKSLGFLYPYLMKEWHLELNGGLNAFELSPSSTSKVWWQCSEEGCHHQWKSTVMERVYKGVECPACRKRSSSIELKKPELVEEWKPAKNSGVKLSDLNELSDRVGVWTCSSCLNDYEMTVQDRLKVERACPYCQKVEPIILRKKNYYQRSESRYQIKRLYQIKQYEGV